MPELPDVEIFKREAQKALGSYVSGVDIHDKHFVDASKYALDNHFVGHKLKEVYRKGKYLFLSNGNRSTIVMHFGMTGFLKYGPEKKNPPKYVKCTLQLANEHHLHYVSKRKLGSFEITNDKRKYLDDLDLGPDALEIEEDEFQDKLAGSHAMIKRFLMDQSEISGIGNVYSDEILFQTGIHPEKKSSQLYNTQARDLYKQTLKVLKTAIENEADVKRFPGNYLLPGREAGGNCPKCSGEIKKIKTAGRTGYYCPRCQTKSN